MSQAFRPTLYPKSMRPALRRLFLLALAHDTLATHADDGWEARCLHCWRRLVFRHDGTPAGNATLEHIVPRAWFGKRAAAALVARVGGDADGARNLAVACARCNHGKGKGPDARGPGDARALEIVGALLDARLGRWRDATVAAGDTHAT